MGDWLAEADRLQRRLPWLAFPVAVLKKFTDDRAGNLAALIAYFTFVAIFPLLLVLVTVLDILARDNPELQKKVLSSAERAYPIFGPKLLGNVHALHSTGPALAIGLVIALLGARGVAFAVQNALNSVWAIPLERRPRMPWSVLRGFGMVAVVGLGLIVTSFLSGIAGGLGHLITGLAAEVGTIALSFVLNVGVFWVAFMLATAAEVGWRDLRLGAVLSAASWQVLLLLGGYLIGHSLRHSSALYGVFGLVLGLVTWLYVQAQITLYAAEASAVRAWRLWPRGLAPPATEQDLVAYERYRQSMRPPPAESAPRLPGDTERA